VCTGGAHLPIKLAKLRLGEGCLRPGFSAWRRPRVAHNCRMSLVQECADAQAAIARARSLFGAAGSIDVPNGATEITDAVQTATAGRDRTVDMAGGAGMPAYREMVDRSIPPLTTASTSDAGLTTHLVTAAAVTQAGATRLDSIAAQTRTISAAAPTARTAADQRAVLTALRGQMAQASQVVQTTQRQAGAAATQIRSLKYPKDAPASSGDGVQALDDTIVDGQRAGTPLVQAAGFGRGGAPLDPGPAPVPPQPQPPAPAPGGSPPQPFLPAWQQALTGPPAPPPPAPPVSLPAGGSPPPPPPQPLGQCVRQRVVPDLGKHMVSDGLRTGWRADLGARRAELLLLQRSAASAVSRDLSWASSAASPRAHSRRRSKRPERDCLTASPRRRGNKPDTATRRLPRRLAHSQQVMAGHTVSVNTGTTTKTNARNTVPMTRAQMSSARFSAGRWPRSKLLSQACPIAFPKLGSVVAACRFLAVGVLRAVALYRSVNHLRGLRWARF
jgi:hypothetical protein